MNIAGRAISRNTPPYIIAELGVNHDGDADRAVEMTHAAALAGAHAVKLQLFTAEGLMSRASALAGYQAAAGERDPRAMLRRLELDESAMRRVVHEAHAGGIRAIVTVFSLELVPLAASLGFDAFKTASPDIVHRPLLEALARTGLPLIVSTGASTMPEVQRAMDWLGFARERLCFLQCVSSYPTPEDGAQLAGITALLAQLGVPIGYSDHTASEGPIAADAVALGACVLEKHMTHSRAALGPDHAASLEPLQLSNYARAAALAFIRRFAGEPLPPRLAVLASAPSKGVQPIEHDVRRVSRQSIVLRRGVVAGEAITADNIAFKRPGYGLAPWTLDRVVGMLASHNLEPDEPLTASDLAPAPSLSGSGSRAPLSA